MGIKINFNKYLQKKKKSQRDKDGDIDDGCIEFMKVGRINYFYRNL